MRARTADAPAACNDTPLPGERHQHRAFVRSSLASAIGGQRSPRATPRPASPGAPRTRPATARRRRAAPPRRTLRRRDATSRSSPGTPDRTRTRAAASRSYPSPTSTGTAPTGGHTDRSAPGCTDLRLSTPFGMQQPAGPVVGARKHRYARGRPSRRPRRPPPAPRPMPDCRQHQRRRQIQLVDHRRSPPRRRRGSPTRQTPRPGTAPRRRRRDRPTSPARSSDNRPVSTTPPEAGSSTTAPSNACSLAANPKPAASAAAPSPREPKPPPLKGIRRQLDEIRVAQHGAPVHVHARRQTPARPRSSGSPARGGPCAARTS